MRLSIISERAKVYGPYKGSKANKGRPLYVIRKEDGTTTSTNKARLDYERENGKLPEKTHVDHIDNNTKNDKKSNLRAIDGGKNVGKENKRRASK
jgi:hypothetical protein